MVIKKVIPFSKAWIIATPLLIALVGQIFSFLQTGFKEIDSGFKSLGWLLMFVAAIKYAHILEKKETV